MSTPVVHKRKPSPAEDVGVIPAARDRALDALGAALEAAERHLFQLNLGAPGAIEIDVAHPYDPDSGLLADGPAHVVVLSWAKLGNKWGLYVAEGLRGDEEKWIVKPLLQASSAHRKTAAHRLPELLREIRATADREVQELKDAAHVARSFADGEFDNG